MKILIVRTFPNMIDPNQYNMQEIGLAKALTKSGHECGIVLYYGKNQDKTEEILVECGDEIRNITVYRLHAFGILKNGFFPSLKKLTEQYDVIQVHEYDQLTSWWYYSFSKKPVVIYHGPYYHPFNKGYNLKCSIFDNTFLKLGHHKDVVCLTKSNAAAEFLNQKGFFDTTAVGVGLDTSLFNNKNNTTDKLNPMIDASKFNLIYVGKIEERRNVFFLLDILETLLKTRKDIKLYVIGNGEREYTQRFLEKAAPFCKAGFIEYIPAATQMQLADIYQKMNLMVFPTNYDIFGMVLLEALYFGLPVISSKNGGADMLLEDGKNGVVETSFDSKSWADKIAELADDKKLYESIKNSLHNRKQLKLDWDDIAEQFITGYQKAIALKTKK